MRYIRQLVQTTVKKSRKKINANRERVNERKIRRAVREYLKANDFLIIPYIPGLYGRKGCADLLCCGTVHGVRGRFVAIETKRPGGKPSPEQLEFLEEVRRHGGIACIASSVQDVIDALDLPPYLL